MLSSKESSTHDAESFNIRREVEELRKIRTLQFFFKKNSPLIVYIDD